MSDTDYNTRIFNDPEPCENIDCTDGYINKNVWDYDHNIFITEKKKCKYCDDNGHKIK